GFRMRGDAIRPCKDEAPITLLLREARGNGGLYLRGGGEKPAQGEKQRSGKAQPRARTREAPGVIPALPCDTAHSGFPFCRPAARIRTRNRLARKLKARGVK